MSRLQCFNYPILVWSGGWFTRVEFAIFETIEPEQAQESTNDVWNRYEIRLLDLGWTFISDIRHSESSQPSSQVEGSGSYFWIPRWWLVLGNRRWEHIGSDKHSRPPFISAPHAKNLLVKGTTALRGLSIECERIESLLMLGCECLRGEFNDAKNTKHLYSRCPILQGVTWE